MDRSSKSFITRILVKIRIWHLFLISLAYLFICAITIILVDVYDVAGIRTYMIEAEFYFQRIWVYIFHEAGPTEMLQWMFLGALALISAFVAGKLTEQNDTRIGVFWFLISIVAFILFLEDSANISHEFYEYTGIFVPHTSILYSRVPVYVVYMIIALVPLVKYWKDIRSYSRTLRYLIGGYLLYGAVSIQSAFLGNFGIDRTVVGDFLLYNVFKGVLSFPFPHQDVSDLFMDTVIEESLELIAATVLFAAIIAFISEKESKEKSPSVNGRDVAEKNSTDSGKTFAE